VQHVRIAAERAGAIAEVCRTRTKIEDRVRELKKRRWIKKIEIKWARLRNHVHPVRQDAPDNCLPLEDAKRYVLETTPGGRNCLTFCQGVREGKISLSYSKGNTQLRTSITSFWRLLGSNAEREEGENRHARARAGAEIPEDRVTLVKRAVIKLVRKSLV